MGRLSALEASTLATFSREVRTRFGDRVTRLELFGSRARGEGRDDSDLDVLVVLRALERDERRAIIDLAADIGVDAGLVLSPHVVSADAWHDGLPLASSIARDGIPL